MKIITLKQPWASLIFSGKNIENRTWKTNHRGSILIHAGKTWDLTCRFSTMQLHIMPKWLRRKIADNNLPISSILGIVDIVDCIKDHKSIWAEPDVWNWVLENPREIKPINGVRGYQGLWDYKSKPGEIIRV